MIKIIYHLLNTFILSFTRTLFNTFNTDASILHALLIRLMSKNFAPICEVMFSLVDNENGYCQEVNGITSGGDEDNKLTYWLQYHSFRMLVKL